MAAEDFDVALSFSGQDRELVRDIAASLRLAGVRVFYDEDNAVEMWGEDLFVYLDRVYRTRARYTVMFVSSHYVGGMWTDHERGAAQARSLEDDRPYLLPARLDDTEVPGLRPTIHYLDVRRLGIDGLVTAITAKVGQGTSGLAPIVVPRSAEESERIAVERPPGWEYLLYAGELRQGIDRLEGKYRDHEIAFARLDGPVLSDPLAVTAVISEKMEMGQAIAANLMKALDGAAQEAAFGAPGVEGDPSRIKHLASKYVQCYEAMLDLAASARALHVPAEFKRLLELTSRLFDVPIGELRDFVAKVVQEISRIPEHMATPEPRDKLEINMQLVLTIDESVVSEIDDEAERLSQLFGG